MDAKMSSTKGSGTEDWIYCASRNVTYDHKVIDRSGSNYCAVPGGGADAILLAALALSLACVLRGKLSAVWLLLFGMITEVAVHLTNTKQLGNATVLWTSAKPPEIFYYIFLPALVFESASNLDFFVFKKVIKKVFAFAVALVFVQTGITALGLVYVLDLKSYGWTLEHGLLMAATLSMTDAVAVNSVLAGTDAPEELGIVLEGESLLNDASGFVLFSMFLKYATDNVPLSVSFVFSEALKDMVWLGAGGAAVGLVFGTTLIVILNIMRKLGLKKEPEVSLSVAIAYLCFYVAEGPAKLSGPIAVVVTGLMVNAIGKAELSPSVQNLWHWSWELFAYMANSMIFFFAGVAAMNFILFSGLHKDFDKTVAIAYLPLIYGLLFAVRFLCICPIWIMSRLTASDPKYAMTINDVVFLTFTALRGAMSLILGNEIILQTGIPEVVKQQIVVWTAGFTLMTILINVPLLPWLFMLTGHATRVNGQAYLHKKAIVSLHTFTNKVVESMLNLEVLRKADWPYLIDRVLPNLPEVETTDDFPTEILDEESPESYPTSDVKLTKASSSRRSKISHSFSMIANFMVHHNIEARVYCLPLCTRSSACESGGTATKGVLYGDKSGTTGIEAEATLQNFLVDELRIEEDPYPVKVCSCDLERSEESTNVYGLTRALDHTTDDLHTEELRARLVAGLKRYIYKKRTEGFLSANGLRWLNYATDKQLHHGGRLSIWSYVEANMVAGRLIRIARALDIFIRRLLKPLLRFKLGRWLSRTTTLPIMRMLNRKHLLSEEIASDYLLALKHGSHHHWLEDAPQLAEEVEAEMATLRKFLEYSEIESPDRTRAIHSYRALVAILTQQLNYIEELYQGGMIKETEREQMCEPIESMLQSTITKGPDWKVTGLLIGLKRVPGFGRFSGSWLGWSLMSKGQLKTFERGSLLMDGSKLHGVECGLSIVLSGFIRNDWEEPETMQLFKSGVCIFGLLSALAEGQPCLTQRIFSEGSLQRGTAIFHLSQSLIEEFKTAAANGDVQMRQLMVDLYRLAAMEVVQLLQVELDQPRKPSTRLKPSSKLWKRASDALKRRAESEVENQELTGISSDESSLTLSRAIISMLEDASVLHLSPKQKATVPSHIVLLRGSVHVLNDGKVAAGCAVLPVQINRTFEPMQLEAGEHGALVVACPDVDDAGNHTFGLLPLPKGSFQYVAWSQHERDASLR